MSNQYRHLIFDLGGVLIELGESPIPPGLLPADAKLTLAEWFSLPTAHQFERGAISAEQFADAFIEDLNLDISIEALLEHFRRWPKRVFPGAENLLENLSKRYRLSVLSNCNEIHWPIMEHAFKILKYFEHRFSSHLIGVTKPNELAFRHVIEKLKATPEEALFFDDNIENIQAAQGMGISSVHVKGIDELQQYLHRNNILE